MIKVYSGPDSGYTAHKLDKELREKLTSEEYQEVIRFDGYKDLSQSVVEDCSSISLFGGRKIVVYTNCYFLSSSTSKKAPFTDAQQGNYRDLKEYFACPNQDTDLYIAVDGDLKKSGELFEALQEGAEIYLENCTLPTDDDFVMLANSMAKKENKEIDPEAVKIFISRCRVNQTSGFGMKGIDYLTFVNGMDKLLTYTNHITSQDVRMLIHRPLEDNVFEIVNKLMNKDTAGALYIYRDLRSSGIEPLGILPAFASKFRDYALVKYLIEMSYDNNEIASQLGKIQKKTIKPGSIYYRRQELANLSFSTALRILSDLAEMEKGIKQYMDDGDSRMELFICSFSREYLRYRR